MMRVFACLLILAAPPYFSARRARAARSRSTSDSPFKTAKYIGNKLHLNDAIESLRNGKVFGTNLNLSLTGKVFTDFIGLGNAHSHENDAQWPSFEDAIARYLFTKSDENKCLGDSLKDKHGFGLYAQWFADRERSVCEGDAAETHARANDLRDFYETCSTQELLGDTDNEALKGFREKYLEHARVWPEGQDPKPWKDKVAQGENPKAIFVLGASGSGKTYSTKLRLESILERNEWDTSLNFISLDGGLMREKSVVWNEVKSLVKEMPAKAHIAGFDDAFKRIGKAGSNTAKKKMQLALIEEGKNIIIPDTLSTACLFDTTLTDPLTDHLPDNIKDLHLCPAMKLYNTLVKKNYDVVLVAINTDMNNCMAQGKARASSENKQYDSKGWKLQTFNLASFFYAARHHGNEHVFMIADNNNHRKVSHMEHCEPESGAKCRKGSVRWYEKGDLTALWHMQVSLQALNGEVTYPCGAEFSCQEVPDDHECIQEFEGECSPVAVEVPGVHE
eukprot:TRINITY_DN12940_c0_g1_i1.p1 TRINITY_DN12940_c0_g1~~TRINITY_DN12940_c0_g1_i1.p1  ORF type:complete len:505 (+),score=57.37 TRINITY_DN12940_c0_g1_i1:55-1569(+)